MVPQAATKVCNYIYAIVTHSPANGRYGPIGVGGGEVYLVSEGPLAAVVSDVPGEKIRPSAGIWRPTMMSTSNSWRTATCSRCRSGPWPTGPTPSAES